MIVASGARGLGSVKPVLDWPPVQAHAGIRKASERPTAIVLLVCNPSMFDVFTSRVYALSDGKRSVASIESSQYLIPDPFPLRHASVGGTPDVRLALTLYFVVAARARETFPYSVASQSLFVPVVALTFNPLARSMDAPPLPPLSKTKTLKNCCSELY